MPNFLTMKHLITVLFSCLVVAAHSQITYTYQTFDDTRIVNGHSIETNTEGIMKFIIGHRFGTLNTGAQNAWGLDNATMRIGLDYGLLKNVTIGIGRSTFEKTLDGYVKYKILTQSSGDRTVPVSLAFVGATTIKTLKRFDNVDVTVADNMAYTLQFLIARKWSDRLSTQIMPTYLHRNLVEDYEQNDILSLGLAGQYQLLKNLSVSAEYYATPSSSLPSVSENPFGYHYNQSLAIGVQIDTKGHVFQLHMGNSQGMVEKFFIAETTDRWSKGGIHLGFNITRDFKVKGRKIRG